MKARLLVVALPVLVVLLATACTGDPTPTPPAAELGAVASWLNANLPGGTILVESIDEAEWLSQATNRPLADVRVFPSEPLSADVTRGVVVAVLSAGPKYEERVDRLQGLGFQVVFKKNPYTLLTPAPTATPTPEPTLTPTPAATPTPHVYEADWKLGNPVPAVVPGWGSTFSGIFPDPERNTVYALNDISAGTVVVWRSMDWGESWESLGDWRIASFGPRVGEIILEQDTQRLRIPIHPDSSRLGYSFRNWPGLEEARETIERESFTDSSDLCLLLGTIAYDPLDPIVVIVGGTVGHDVCTRSMAEGDFTTVLFLSTDGRNTWVPVDTASLTPFQKVIPFRSLAVVQDTRGDIHLFAGTDRVWHAVLSAE